MKDDTLPRGIGCKTRVLATAPVPYLDDGYTRVERSASGLPRTIASEFLVSGCPDFALTADDLRAVEDSGEWARAEAAGEHPLHTVLRVVGVSADGFVLTLVSE